MYEVVWNRFLPASLSLLLLAPSVDDDEEVRNEDSDDINLTKRKGKRIRDITRYEIGVTFVPFLLGCIGSTLGCLTSYFLCWLGKDNIHRVHKHNPMLRGKKHHIFRPGRLLLQPTEAAVAAGCLLSSYIGGSTNYFQTARMIARDGDLDATVGAEGVIK